MLGIKSGTAKRTEIYSKQPIVYQIYLSVSITVSWRRVYPSYAGLQPEGLLKQFRGVYTRANSRAVYCLSVVPVMGSSGEMIPGNSVDYQENILSMIFISQEVAREAIWEHPVFFPLFYFSLSKQRF